MTQTSGTPEKAARRVIMAPHTVQTRWMSFETPSSARTLGSSARQDRRLPSASPRGCARDMSEQDYDPKQDRK